MRVEFLLDGQRRELDVPPAETLASALRHDGVQRGCADGRCGECTVLVDGEPTRSCLMFAVQCAGAVVRTAVTAPPAAG